MRLTAGARTVLSPPAGLRPYHVDEVGAPVQTGMLASVPALVTCVCPDSTTRTSDPASTAPSRALSRSPMPWISRDGEGSGGWCKASTVPSAAGSVSSAASQASWSGLSSPPARPGTVLSRTITRRPPIPRDVVERRGGARLAQEVLAQGGPVVVVARRAEDRHSDRFEHPPQPRVGGRVAAVGEIARQQQGRDVGPRRGDRVERRGQRRSRVETAREAVPFRHHVHVGDLNERGRHVPRLLP